MRKGEKNNGEFSRIQVFARCRPLNGYEIKQKSLPVVEVFPKEKKVTVREKNKEYTFDKVFQPDVKQLDVYKSVAEPLIQEVLKGFNCTILAYGQTGTGKTYTMEGERSNFQCSWEDDPGAGLIPRSLHQLFEELNKGDNVEFSVRVSFMELYNEELYDLLSSEIELPKLRIYENPSKKGHSVSQTQRETQLTAKRSQGVGSAHIDRLEEFVVNSKDEVYAIIEKGTARRQKACTQLNDSSSRSHTVFSVTVHIKENTSDGEELVKTGKLNLVDLAGSECVGRSGCVNQRFREASNINMSLLTLGRVITALIENQSHIPYRESKLTRLLQDSLGGHTKTSFIATISPAQCNLEETMSTLDYATKAKNVTNKPTINEKMTKRALIRDLNKEIECLRKDLSAHRKGEGFFVDPQNYAQLEKDAAEKKVLEEKIKSLEEEREVLIQQTREIEQSLHLKTKQHEEIVSKYTEVSETLCNTEKVLSKTALDRDEKAYLLNIHHNKEKQLLEQNRKLHQVVDESTTDVDGLHLKLERKIEVETANEENLKQFQQKYHREFIQLHDMVNSLKQEQFTHLNNFANSLKKDIFEEGLDIYNGILNYHKQSTDVLHKIETNQSSFLNDLSSTLSNDAAEQEKMSNLLLENLNSKRNALLADQEMFCANIPSLSETFSNILAKMRSWFFDNHSSMIQKIERFENQMKTQLEEKCKEIKDISSNLETFLEQHSILLTKLDEAQIENSLIDKRVDKNLSQIYDLLNEISKDRSLMKNKESSIEETKQSMKEGVANVHVNVNLKLQKLPATLKEDFASGSVVLDELSSSYKPSEFTSHSDAVNCFYNSEKSEITTFIKNNQQKQESSLDMIKDEIGTNAIVTQSNYKSKKSKLKEYQISFCDEIQDDVSNLNDCKNNVLGIISSTETMIKDSKQNFQESCEQLDKEILEKELVIQKFISEDLKKDIPTGTTPQRKTYYYPKELINLSPDEEKLRPLRKLRCEHTENAVNLQLDCSFDERDEFKSPLSQEFCEVTVGSIAESIPNGTCTKGDEDLTDCETLSNASSVSDLSVTGLKNKENSNVFPKPSTNRLKVKRPKKKLVESSIPTPTQRKPLSSKNPSLLG